jgi:L-lysine 2,3-aminomutase
MRGSNNNHLFRTQGRLHNTSAYNVDNINTKGVTIASQFVQIKNINCSMSSLSNILFERLKVSSLHIGSVHPAYLHCSICLPIQRKVHEQ